MLKQLKEFVSIKNERIHLIKPGVDYNRFLRIEEIANRNLFPENYFNFLILGRIIKVKGIDLAINAISNINHLNVRLRIVGDGPELKFLKDLTRELKLGEKVEFRSETLRPEKYYLQADAFLMTSSYESFGQTILEAMSSGLPIIGFKPDGHKVKTSTNEIVEDQINGFLCDYRIEDLVACMVKLIAMPKEKRNEISNRNREKVIKNYSWENFSNKLTELCSN
jgi:glycosyltransferase involved in cell wall biosynthesis